MNPELGYAERDRVISKISLAATLHQADQATISYLGHFSKTLVESLGEDAKPVLPIFQELLAVKELRSRYLERRRSLLEQKQAAESSTRHLKAAIADLEGLEEASSQEQPPEEGKMPQTLAKNILGLDHPTPPSVPPSYNGPSVVGGLVVAGLLPVCTRLSKRCFWTAVNHVSDALSAFVLTPCAFAIWLAAEI